jgi:hypothetical protein
MARLHGGLISSGVGAIIESAAQALASSRYLQHLGEKNADPELLKRAAALSEVARQHELAAWELAARECKARGAKPRPLAARLGEQAAALRGTPI